METLQKSNSDFSKCPWGSWWNCFKHSTGHKYLSTLR